MAYTHFLVENFEIVSQLPGFLIISFYKGFVTNIIVIKDSKRVTI